MRVFISAIFTTLAGVAALAESSGPRFFRDDPLWQAADTQDASSMSPYEIDLTYDALENLFYRPGDPAVGVRARNLNTLEEVPDSSWYTNRVGYAAMTREDIERGPNRTNGPAPGAWTVTSSKMDGITPGFVVVDEDGVTWFLKFDAPDYPGMATGAEVIATKLLWALGYNVPENHIASFMPEQLRVGPKATIRTPAGKRPMKQADVTAALRTAARQRNGSYRALASRQIAGKPLGGFRFYGTRPDDPNDYVPHEHRRELRAYGTFAAWLNHVDCKAINTFDVLVRGEGRSRVLHYLLDFGSTLGSAAIQPREPFEGSRPLIDRSATFKALLSLGFKIDPWRRMNIVQGPEIGALPADQLGWDPEQWTPRYPNPAFLRSLAEDKFWAARRLQAFSRDMLIAAIRTAEYGDASSEAIVLRFLSERRQAILRRYLPALNPVVDPTLDEDGMLRFGNAAVDADVAPMPAGYRTVWARFDNHTGKTTLLAERETSGVDVQGPDNLLREVGEYVRVAISAIGAAEPSWSKPVHAYFRREPGRWSLVGFERVPTS